MWHEEDWFYVAMVLMAVILIGCATPLVPAIDVWWVVAYLIIGAIMGFVVMIREDDSVDDLTIGMLTHYVLSALLIAPLWFVAIHPFFKLLEKYRD